MSAHAGTEHITLEHVVVITAGVGVGVIETAAPVHRTYVVRGNVGSGDLTMVNPFTCCELNITHALKLYHTAPAHVAASFEAHSAKHAEAVDVEVKGKPNSEL